MDSSEARYHLKRFSHPREADFIAALAIYTRNTQGAVRTSTNEITYWLNKFEKKYGSVFYAFGFYRNGQLVGFAEACFLRPESLLMFDYLVIDQPFRGNNVYYEFVDQLRRYLEEAHPDFRFAVAEACYGPGLTRPSRECALHSRLMKLQGFRVARAPYYQPRLSLNDAESEMNADLLFFAPDSPADTMRIETYLRVVRCIYFDYYLPWKGYTPGGTEAYERYIGNLYQRVKREIGQASSIVINGHKAVLPQPAREPVMTVHKIVVFAVQALSVVLILTVAITGLRTYFHLSNGTLAVVYGFAMVSFALVSSLVSKNARLVLSEITAVIKHVVAQGAVNSQSVGKDGRLRDERNKPPSLSDGGGKDEV